MGGSIRAAEFADRFEQSHAEVLAFAEGCPHDRWAAVTDGERWPVGVVLDHIAKGYGAFNGWVSGYLEGRPVPDTGALIDEANARHAVEAADVTREQVLERLRDGAAAAAATLRGLSDEQLAISHPMEMAGGAAISAEQLAAVLLRHTSRHLSSCREATAG